MGEIFTRDGVVHCCERYTRITTKLELQLNHLIIKHKRHIAFCNLQTINQSINQNAFIQRITGGFGTTRTVRAVVKKAPTHRTVCVRLNIGIRQ